MKTGRQLNRRGTVSDYEVEPGYTANGESEYSRVRAHGAPQIKLNANYTRRVRSRKGTMLPLDMLIRETESKLAWLRCEVNIESDPVKVAKLQKSIFIKAKYLDQLRREGRQ
jgi:hypothetical protein